MQKFFFCFLFILVASASTSLANILENCSGPNPGNGYCHCTSEVVGPQACKAGAGVSACGSHAS